MKVLVIGGGGREHAIVWKLAQSKKLTKIFCAPGNAGISEHAECVAIPVNDVAGLLKFAKENKMDITIVGPEEPLSLGIVDQFQKEGLAIFGPTQAAAKLESSKIFTKEFCKRHQIPQAGFRIFNTSEEAKEYLENAKYPLVLKADGLAGGKGVIICQNSEEALQAVDCLMVEKTFGAAGNKILLEEFLEGEELSFIAFVDGRHVMSLASAKDHKRLLDHDQGPNTGGMGAFSPSPLVTSVLYEKIMNQIMYPTVRGMAEEETPFVGFLYAGLMLVDGEPKLLEFNVRLGDPEAQVILMRLRNDLMDLVLAALKGELNSVIPSWETKIAACVVMASKGYPEKYEKGFSIQGLGVARTLFHDGMVFHAGTAQNEGNVVTAGGRVLGVTALGDDLKQALNKSYEMVKKIYWEGCYYRKDIGGIK